VSTPQPPGVPDRPAGEAPPGGTQVGTTPTSVPAEEAPPEEDRPSTWQPMLWVKIGLLLLVTAYAIAFVAENGQRIDVHFVFATERVRLIWAILLLLGVGLLGGILLSQLYRHRRRSRLAKQPRK
jgi:uncharacterized membrane protein YciS (DUF1049 family)